MDASEIIPYVEPIFRFCCKRLGNRYDAEDLASEIICHILDGMGKYEITSLDAWVWRIAHNRYARFINEDKKRCIILSGEDTLFDMAYRDQKDMDEEMAEKDFNEVFCYLHTLSAQYRNIFIDYYIGEMSIRDLAIKYSLPETTIKWRLNAGREKIRKRIGGKNMEKVYRRINWNTTCCNGSIDTDKYLHTQIARAICQAVYEKPLTVEEISMCTGIPAMYIEDEIPRLEQGEAVCKVGNKYATNFIIFRLQDRKVTESIAESLVQDIADKFEKLLKEKESCVRDLKFWGHDFGMDRLGYIVIHYVLRRKIGTIKSKRLHLENGPFPIRNDGGCGWFIVEETVDEKEERAEYNAGCNITEGSARNKGAATSRIYYYHISKYFDYEVYSNRGICWLQDHGVCETANEGVIKKDSLKEEDIGKLIENNLIVKAGNEYTMNFAHFTESQFEEFISLFDAKDEKLDAMIEDWIRAVRADFDTFVPKRLSDQINQWVSTYLFQMIGYVTDELIDRGVLRKPDKDKPLTDGIFCAQGKWIDP